MDSTKGDALMASETKPTETDPVAAPAPAPAAAPPVDITKTPEFIAAVAAAAQQTQATMLASMSAILAASQGGPSANTISDLTAAIVGMQDPKNTARRISPAEAAKRQAAFEAMGALISAMQAEKQTAKYKVVSKVYLSDQMIEPSVSVGNGQWDDVVIYWNSMPSPGMRPLDERAEAIYEQYLVWIGGSTKNPAGVVEQPTWVHGGILMVGTPSQTAVARGGVRQVPVMEIDALASTVVRSSPDKSGATAIRVLGTVAEPARVNEPGQSFK